MYERYLRNIISLKYLNKSNVVTLLLSILQILSELVFYNRLRSDDTMSPKESCIKFIAINNFLHGKQGSLFFCQKYNTPHSTPNRYFLS